MAEVPVGAINYPGFIGDAERIELDQAMKRVARAIAERGADFLFGAGMSVPAPSSIPAGGVLAGNLLALFFPDGEAKADPAKAVETECPLCGGKTKIPARTLRLKQLASALPFECIAEAIENCPGRKRDDLTTYLRQLLYRAKFEINAGHREFLGVCYWDGQSRLRRIFTTNFDPLLEEALSVHGVAVTEKNANKIEEIQERGQIPVLHLHGTLDEEYEITESDIFKKTFRKLHSRFRIALDEADAFVFVGYSMSDPDFRSLYLEHRDQMQLRKEAKKDAYVVAPARDHYSYVLAKGVWKSRYAIYLPLDAESFFAGIKHFLEQTGREELKDKIMKKYGLKDEGAFDDKVRQTAEILNIAEAEAVRFLFEARTKTGAKE